MEEQKKVNEAFHMYTWAKDRAGKYGKLIEKHRWMYEGIFPEVPFYLFGFDIGEGWYEIIKKLLADIEKEIKKDPGLKKEFRITQIKEKWGSLCFYVTCANNAVFDLIGQAETASEKVCENCGKKSKVREVKGWYTSLCNSCLKKKKS